MQGILGNFFISSVPANAEVGQYSYETVLLSYLVASFAAYTAFSIALQIANGNSHWPRVHKFFAVVALGSGIWAMHFIGMLAYNMRMEMKLDIPLTILSLIISLTASYLLFNVVQKSNLTAKDAIIASSLMALGVAGMHYTGMAAMIMDADIRYLPGYFMLSVLGVLCASAVAISIFFKISHLSARNQSWAMLAGALVMGGAICSMHYIAMEGAVFIPWANCSLGPQKKLITLTLLVSGLTSMIVAISLSTKLFGGREEAITSVETQFHILSKLQYLSFLLILVLLLTLGFFSYNILSNINMAEHFLIAPSNDSKAYQLLDNISGDSFLVLFLVLPSIVLLTTKIILLWRTRKLMALILQERAFNQNILDSVPDPIFVKTKEHVWQAGNKALWKMLGGKQEEFIGFREQKDRNPDELRHFWEKDDYVIRTGNSDSSEEKVTDANGVTIVALTTKVPITLPNGNKGLVGIVRDITPLKRAEKELAAHRDNLQKQVVIQTQYLENEKRIVGLLLSISNLANEAMSLERVLSDVLRILGEYIKLPVGHAYVRNPQNNQMISSRQWYLPSPELYREFVAETEERSFGPEQGIAGNIMATRKHLWITDLATSPFFKRKNSAALNNLRSAAAFPIIYKDNVEVVIEFFATEKLEVRQEIIFLFENIARQLSAVVERGHTSRQMREAMLAAQKANALKSDFLANMSHELRTPMHSIITFSRQGIERISKWGAAEHGENLALIKQSGERLMLLLNNLLDLSKLEAGAVEYHFVPHELSVLVKRCVRHLQSLFLEKQLTTDISFPDDFPEVECDETKIMQVIFNLLSNAIKFAPSQTQISVTGEVDVSQQRVLVHVMDRGVGIPKEELLSIFDKFVQSSKTKTGAGGTGLGLAICRQIIDDHNGEIFAANNENGGACFTIMLPVKQKSRLMKKGHYDDESEKDSAG